MEFILSETEARVLGCLIEKEALTPDYYPLTLNSLINACNQKSSRLPVMSLDESETANALFELRMKGLANQVDTVGYRASKFEHKIDEAFGFSQEEAAIICLLLLRGAQTPGEIRTRSGRLCDFDSPAQVEQVLEKLAEMENGPFVKKLPRQPGKRESRYIHLFRGEPEPGEENDLSVQSDFNSVSVPAPFYSEKISALEAEVGELREKLENLEAKFEAFVKEFE